MLHNILDHNQKYDHFPFRSCHSFDFSIKKDIAAGISLLDMSISFSERKPDIFRAR